MSPIKLRHALASLGVLAALVPAVPAQAASISYINGNSAMSFTDNNCTTGFVLSGNTLSCQSGGGAQPTTPTGCQPTLSTTPSPLTSAGGTVNLDVTGCSPPTGLTYSWTKNAQSFSTQRNPQDSLPANTSTTTLQTSSYQVTVCNDTACTTPLPAQPLTATVPVASGGSNPPPTPTGAISCPGFRTTIVMDFSWGPKATATRVPVPAPFGNGDIVVARFTTPANLAKNGSPGFVSVAEYAGSGAGGSADRTAVLSTLPCDFNYDAVLGSHAQYMNAGVGSSAQVNFSTSIYGGVVLQPGKTYYFNVKNDRFGTPTCGAPDCPASVTLGTN